MESQSTEQTEQSTEKQAEQKQYITRQTTIGDIIGAYPHPDVVETLMSFGVHCVGCQASAYESLEDGFAVHGMDDTAIDEAVKQLNAVIGKLEAEKSVESKEEVQTDACCKGGSKEDDHCCGGESKESDGCCSSEPVPQQSQQSTSTQSQPAEQSSCCSSAAAVAQPATERPHTETPAPQCDLTLTEAAASKIKELLQKENKADHGLRIKVIPGGCAGFQYSFSFDNTQADDDNILDKHGVQVYVDNNSLELLNKASIDFVDNLNESGFKIENPNAKSGCGCGKSFN
jgi:iron-sulfur cluster insertion protein